MPLVVLLNIEDTLSVNVKFGGQNWPNIKWALQGFSGLFHIFYGIFMAEKWLFLQKKS